MYEQRAKPAQGGIQGQQQFGSFPSSGWGYAFAGDADRGYGRKQPGGWIYQTLPYIEETTLHDLGKGQAETPKKAANTTRLAAVLAILDCPTRGRADLKPFTKNDYFNANATPFVAGSDYAGNGGSQGFGNGDARVKGDSSLLTMTKDSDVENYFSASSGTLMKHNGITFIRSEVKSAHIKDGLSKTYYIGERYLDFRFYEVNTGDDDQSWDSGYDWDVNRWTNAEPKFDQNPGSPTSNGNFGSAHLATFNMAFCDGSVRAVPYEVSFAVHTALGNRAGGNDDLSQIP
ncbi:MAG: DUF1559 domain-containing protein [Pirellulales bacterium]